MPAIEASRNGRLTAIASRRADAAADLAGKHAIGGVYSEYERVLEDRDVDAVYLPLVNSLHREWALRALQAGKHVLCEKPLAMNEREAREMAAEARSQGRTLMEAFMYRFHPRMRRFREEAGETRFVHAAFGFTMAEAGNYRASREFGGGALLDVGCYCVNAARWFLGEPASVTASAHTEGGVDMTVSAVLDYGPGQSATLWGSFESDERQLLVAVGDRGPRTLATPFTAWKDPADPYQLMVEAFADSVLEGSDPPLSLEDSIANLRVLDEIRASAGLVQSSDPGRAKA
jgi:xylose dehydrogenase (NAD/NADP)